MVGHRKWSKVKHFKGILGRKRGKFFSKRAKEITVAAKLDGGDPDANPRLRTKIFAARAQSLLDGNTGCAIQCASGERSNARQLEELVCKGHALGGTAIIEVAVKYTSRVTADLRLIFFNIYGIIASSSKARQLLKRQGPTTVPIAAANDEKMREADAEYVNTGKKHHVFNMAHDQLYTVGELLVRVGIEPDAQALTYLPDTTVDLAEESIAA